MSPLTIAAAVGILLAAAIYTVAVFAERRAGVLKPRHLALFWAGFVVDTTATTLMSVIAGGIERDLHGFLGFSAIAVMAAHTIWATIVLVRQHERWLARFHTLSLAVWALWMITLVTGFSQALPKMMR